MWEKSDSDCVCQGKAWKRRKNNTLSSHLRLILDIETAYTKDKTQNKQTPGKGENLIFGVITLLDSNVCCSTTTTKKNTRYIKKQEIWPNQRKTQINRNCL